MTTTTTIKTSRMSLSNATRGRQDRPVRVLLYGMPGVGKSTWAAQAPDPIFLCSEDGTAHLDVMRFPSPRTMLEMFDAIGHLIKEQHDRKTLVIDTVDWLEPLIESHVCATHGKSNIEDFGFGKGTIYALDQWRMLCDRLDVLVQTRKMHVVLLGHASVVKHDDPQVGTYDRHRVKVARKAADVLQEWVDALLFARHEMYVTEVGVNKKKRGHSTGSRVVHTEWNAAFDAKNRFGLPETIALDWQEFFELTRRGMSTDRVRAIQAEIEEMLPLLDDKTREAAHRAMVGAGTDGVRLTQIRDRVRMRVASAQESSNESPEDGDGQGGQGGQDGQEGRAP